MRQTTRRPLTVLILMAVLAGALSLAIALPANAINIFVQSTADSGGTCPGATCTLRQAIAVATPFDAVKFSLPAGSTITLLGPITVSTQVTVFGPGAGNLTIIGRFLISATGDIGFTDLTIQGNGVATAGPRFFVNSGGYLSLVRCIVQNGAFDGFGGAISAPGGGVTVQDSAFNNNQAAGGTSGGAISAGGIVVIERSTFSGNSATGSYGAIHFSGTSLTVTDSAFQGNLAYGSPTGNGGAIGILGGSATIAGSTFTSNKAGLIGFGNGGAIYSTGTLTVTNSTFTQNEADNGTALYNSGTATVTHVTMAGNNSPLQGRDGGAINNGFGATLQVQNSIFAKNALYTGFRDVYGAITSLKYNLVQYPGPSTGWDPSLDRLNTDPQLFPLGDYGGPTQTMPAGIGGFVIDAIPSLNGCNGANVTVDQRGVARPQGAACDRGAFEKVPGMTSTVTFNSNGGSAVAPQTVPFNTPTTAPAPPIRNGYIFGGWYSDVGLTTAFVFTTPIAANITLFAKWNVIAAPTLQGAKSRKVHGVAGAFDLPL